MKRRFYTILATISIAMLIYASLVWLLFSRMNKVFGKLTNGEWLVGSSLYSNGLLNVFGLYVPIQVIFVLAILPIFVVVVFELFQRYRGRSEEPVKVCRNCGFQFSVIRDRCPCCGLPDHKIQFTSRVR